MLADTDAGSIMTAAQSGARWGYGMMPIQILLIPVLFMVQEITLRLGLGTGKGYNELVLQHFGKKWAMISTLALGISCLGALTTQLGGLAGIGQIWGIPVWATVSASVGLIFLMVWTGSYHGVERVALVLGLFELAFVVAAWRAAPDLDSMTRQMTGAPYLDRHYLYLLAANLGTSIMPWTVFYQQSAIIDKGLDAQDIKAARLDTAVGALVCQAITVAVLVTAAAFYGHGGGADFDTIPAIAQAFSAVLGDVWGKVIFSLGLSGGALVATIVVCLAAAWGMGEACGIHHSLEQSPATARRFYVSFGLMLLAGGALVASGLNLVDLSIAVGVLNAALLPFILGIVFILAYAELPGDLRLHGWYAWVVGITFVLTAGLSVISCVLGLLG